MKKKWKKKLKPNHLVVLQDFLLCAKDDLFFYEKTTKSKKKKKPKKNRKNQGNKNPNMWTGSYLNCDVVFDCVIYRAWNNN